MYNRSAGANAPAFCLLCGRKKKDEKTCKNGKIMLDKCIALCYYKQAVAMKGNRSTANSTK